MTGLLWTTSDATPAVMESGDAVDGWMFSTLFIHPVVLLLFVSFGFHGTAKLQPVFLSSSR